MHLFTSFIAITALFNIVIAHPHAPAITPAPILARDGSLNPQTTSKKTSDTTCTTKKTTKTKKTSTTTSTTTTSSSGPACTQYGEQKLVSPTQGQVFHYDPNVDDGSVNIPVIYCSGQYFKTYSISADVWLGTSKDSGEIITLQQKPDDADAGGGYNSYRFNATIYPIDGDYYTGSQQFNFYEVASGYYNAYNYNNNFVTIKFAKKSS